MKHKENETMWIRSQDKTKLVKCLAFSISKNFGGKKKGAIMGTTSYGRFWGETQIILGLYNTKEDALNELSKLQKELINNTEIYEMS